MYIKGCFSFSVCFTRLLRRCPDAHVYITARSYRKDGFLEMERRKKEKHLSRADRYKQKLGDNLKPSNQVTLSVVSTGAQGLGRCILLHTDQERYLFNCPEGAQKYLVHMIPRMSACNTFITYNSWDNIGGLIGCILTYTDQISPSEPLLIHGPKNVDVSLEVANMFSESNTAGDGILEWRGIEHKQYEDTQIVVEYVELHSNKSTKMSPPSPGGSPTRSVQMSPPSSFKPVASGSGEPERKRREIININEKTVMAYIVKLKKMSPSVDVLKLKATGKKPGPWVKQVLDGETVTVGDLVIRPEDIIRAEQKDVGPIIILDCPTLDYLDALVSNEQILNIDSKYDMPPHIVVHMAPRDILNLPLYKQFMDRFETNTQHLLLNEDSKGPYIMSAQENQAVLNQIHPKLFPELCPVPDRKPAFPDYQPQNVFQGFQGLKYKLRPERTKGYKWTERLFFNKSAAFDRIKSKACHEAINLVSRSRDRTVINQWSSFSMETIDEEFKKLKSKLAQVESDQDISKEYPELTFLGTGSAKPSGTRNASGILVQMRKDEYLLLDCGEATLIQMLQLFGPEKTDHILSKTKAVFLSHLHYDHHGGLLAIAEARERVVKQEGRKDRLLVLAPEPFRKWGDIYSKHIVCRPTPLQFLPVTEKKYLDIVRQQLDLVECLTPKVRHTTTSYGIVIKHRDGWKLVYSGDCMPSRGLVRDGKDCDILIHEGTLDDSQAEHAKKTKHSTSTQALEVAKEMNAKFTILTHFSQRYPYIPLFTDKFTDKVGFSFDFMQVRPSQYKLIPLLKPFLFCLFGAHVRLHLRTELESGILESSVDCDIFKTKEPANNSNRLEEVAQKLMKSEQKLKLKMSVEELAAMEDNDTQSSSGGDGFKTMEPANNSERLKQKLKESLMKGEQKLKLGKSTEDLTDLADNDANNSANKSQDIDLDKSSNNSQTDLETEHSNQSEVGVKRKASWQNRDSKQQRTSEVKQIIKS